MVLAEPRSEGWRVVSVVVGWVYFTAWTVSFWPQIYTNWKRKSVQGLSYSFNLANTVGFLCLTIYSVVKFALERHYGLSEAVQIQDVCFAIHAFIASFVTVAQIVLYDNQSWHVKFNRWVRYSLLFIGLLALIQVILVASKVQCLSDTPETPVDNYRLPWSFTDYFSWVKILITLLKYIPQLYLNFKNKSTHGVAIWNWNLDVTGGLLSIAQNVIDYINYDDMSFVTSNITKYVISCLSVLYDFILLFQHYVLFRGNRRVQEQEEEERRAHKGEKMSHDSAATTHMAVSEDKVNSTVDEERLPEELEQEIV